MQLRKRLFMMWMGRALLAGLFLLSGSFVVLACDGGGGGGGGSDGGGGGGSIVGFSGGTLDFQPGNWSPPADFFIPADKPGVVNQPDQFTNWGGTPFTEREKARMDWERELHRDILTLMEDPVIAGSTVVGFIPAIMGGPISMKLVTFAVGTAVKSERIDANPDLKAAYDRIMGKLGPKPKNRFVNQSLIDRAHGRNK
ncbi:MAG: hypothetical protein KKC99_12800 [Proteobacteria bacterium]|nr:hypothetical protein [Pseudomonadota bacterium]